MSEKPRFVLLLERLLQASPPPRIVVVGAGTGDGAALDCLRANGIREVLLVEADPDQFQELSRCPVEGWNLTCDVVGPESGPVVFHGANLHSENGILDPGLLAGFWPGIVTTSRREREAITLSDLVVREAVRPNWLLIDCLPVLPIVSASPEVLDFIDVLVARVVTTSRGMEPEGSALDVLRPYLEDRGFRMMSIEGSRHPAFGHALFARRGTPEHSTLLAAFPTTAGLLSDDVRKVREAPESNPWLNAHFKILRSELDLIQHELLIAEARGQLQVTSGDTPEPPADPADAEERWLAQLRSKAKSQLGQELWVLEMTSYKRGGFFVEFGATDGVMLSNSYLLEKEFGWRGICAEPNPSAFEALRVNRGCQVSPHCVGPVSGEEVEFIFAEAYGGMARDFPEDGHGAKRDAYREAGQSTILRTVSLDDLLTEYQAPTTIDYISIDTEGSEFAILETFPFDKWNVIHFSIEHNFTEQRGRIRELLESHGYICVEAQWDDWYYKQP